MENTLVGTAEVVQHIKRILVEDLDVGVSPDEISDDYSLMEGGLALDSILIAELIAQIENRFGLQFDDQIFDEELFENLSALGDFVRECLAAKSRAAGIA
jgi:acyl carrier protein